MKKLLTLLLILQSSIIFSQTYFEGTVKFDITFESLDSRYSDETIANFYGNWMVGVVQENRYLVYLPIEEQDTMKVYYFLETSDGYIEQTNSDTIRHFRIDEEPGALISCELQDDQKIILGDTCKSIKIDYLPKESYLDKVEGTYYYNSKYKLNPKYYENHKDSFWNLFVSKTKSISVRNEMIHSPLYKSIYQANEINVSEINDALFILDQNKIIVKQK